MIKKLVEMLENLERLQKKVNTLLSLPLIKYQSVRKNLQTYKRYLSNYQIDVKGKLRNILPAIRARKKSEADLNQLMVNYTSSPARYQKSYNFLLRRNREIQALQYLLEQFDVKSHKNKQIMYYEYANDVSIKLAHPRVVVFSMNILQVENITESFLNGNEIDESEFWFNNGKSVSYLGKQIRLFNRFASSNKDNIEVFYLVKINKRQATLIDVVSIKNGEQSRFQIPTEPVKPKVISKTHDSVTIQVIPPSNVLIKKFYLSYWNMFEGEETHKKTILVDFSKGTYTINNLSPFTFYQYCVVHHTEFGISPASPVGENVTTLPTSVPSNLMVADTTASSIIITWEPPAIVTKNFTIIKYNVSIVHGKVILMDFQNSWST